MGEIKYLNIGHEKRAESYCRGYTEDESFFIGIIDEKIWFKIINTDIKRLRKVLEDNREFLTIISPLQED